MRGLREPQYHFEVEVDAECIRCHRLIRGGGSGVTASHAKDHARADLLKAYELHFKGSECKKR